MGVGVQAVPAELTACAGAASALAEQVGGLAPAGPVDLITDWLPGTTAAGAAGTLGDTWTTRVAALATDVDAHAQRLSTSASNYRGTDDYNAAALPRTAQ